MKTIIMILLLASISQVGRADVSNYIITTTGKDGKSRVYDSKEWMVIPRKPKKKAVPKAKAACVASETLYTSKVVEVRVVQKNHLRLLGGVGPTGVGLDRNPNYVSLTRNNMLVMGVGYGRNVSERWSLESAVLTNGTALLGVGYNW